MTLAKMPTISLRAASRALCALVGARGKKTEKGVSPLSSAW